MTLKSKNIYYELGAMMVFQELLHTVKFRNNIYYHDLVQIRTYQKSYIRLKIIYIYQKSAFEYLDRHCIGCVRLDFFTRLILTCLQ